MRVASPGLPPVDPQSGRRRTRRLIIIGLVVLVVVGAVTLFLWQETERQSRQDRHAVAEAVAQARAADARLRNRIEDLEPLVIEAEATARTAASALGDDDSAVRSLIEALGVARALRTSVASNPVDVPESPAGASAALREDEDQLALIEPVVANLKAARETAAGAVNSKALREAKTGFDEATTALNTALEEAGAVLARVDQRVADLTVQLNLPISATPSPTLSPTPSQEGAATVKATAKERRAARQAATKQAKQAKRAAKLSAELADLKQASQELTAAVRAAQEVHSTNVDQTNADELRAATRQRQVEADALATLTTKVLADHAALADQPVLTDSSTLSATPTP